MRDLSEHLKSQHRLVLFAPDEAHEFLQPIYANDPQVEVREIPGLRFQYRNGRMALGKTIATGLGFRARLRGMVGELAETIRREQPDLVLTDFEPLLPRAARECGVPYLSVDHQHFLLGYDLSILPWSLRQYARVMAQFVRMFHRWQAATIVSGFFFPPLRAGYEDYVQVGTFLRPEVEAAETSPGDYILSYLRRNTPPGVLEVLAGCGCEVRIYGLGERPGEGNLRFFPIDQYRFVEDMAGAAGLVSAAGNQMLGEALYFGKPVLALPESSHHEQLINSHFLVHLGGGLWRPVEQLAASDVREFFGRLDHFRGQIAPLREQLNGTPRTMAEIGRHLASR